jgi:plasmid stabilization system protein ParE
MKLRYRELALADLESIFQFLNDRSPTGAHNVLRAIHEAIGEIAAHPLSAPRTSEGNIRVKILGRYRYKIFYSVTDETVEIIHIRHAARRPWIER